MALGSKVLSTLTIERESNTLTVKYIPPDVYVQNQLETRYRISRHELGNTDCNTHTRCTASKPGLAFTTRDYYYQHHTVPGRPELAKGYPHVDVTVASKPDMLKANENVLNQE